MDGMNEIETFYGLIEGTSDALRVFELCRLGRLGRVRRRLHEKERRLIRSGSVFVFDEQESGIRRWTDGRLWSPSRILGNFLIYRELERKVTSSHVQPQQHGNLENGNMQQAKILPWLSATPFYLERSEGEVEENGYCYGNEQPIIDPTRCESGCVSSLLGPNSFRLLKSKKLQSAARNGSGTRARYNFKPEGLLKKTISAKVDGRMQHLVCYFSELDFLRTHGSAAGALRLGHPLGTLMEELRKTRIPPDLVLQQNFRKPAECGLPMYERNKRRHSIHATMGLGEPRDEVSAAITASSTPPLYLRTPPELSALDLASSWSHSLPSDDLTTMPDSATPLELAIDVDHLVPLSEGPHAPSSQTLMEECLRIVLDSRERDPLSHAPCANAMISANRDPPMPVLERPDSIPPTLN